MFKRKKMYAQMYRYHKWLITSDFQKMCLAGRVNSKRSLLLESASSIVIDVSGNPKLEKSHMRGRIAALQATILAVGMGERAMLTQINTIYHGRV